MKEKNHLYVFRYEPFLEADYMPTLDDAAVDGRTMLFVLTVCGQYVHACAVYTFTWLSRNNKGTDM